LAFAFALILAFPLANAGRAFGETAIPAASQPPAVIVYYANETVKELRDLPEFLRLRAILRKSASPLAGRLVKILQDDIDVYPGVVAREQLALETAARRLHVDLAIFTNKLALEGHYLFYDAPSDRLERRPFAIAAKDDGPFVALAPLSRPDVLHAALDGATAAASRPASEMVLLVNTHGTMQMALMPRINVDLSIATEAEILERLDEGGRGDQPPWAKPHGTSKVEFWNILADVVRSRNVRFPLVARLACQSGLSSLAELETIPPSVALFAHTGTSSPSIGDIDLAAAISKSDGPDWLARMPNALRQSGFYVETPRRLAFWLLPIALWQVPTVFYFVPLLAWAAWRALRWTRERPRHA
jgi:hypothetical protein